MTKQRRSTKDSIAHFRIPRDVRTALKAEAARRGMSLSGLLRESAMRIYRRLRRHEAA